MEAVPVQVLPVLARRVRERLGKQLSSTILTPLRNHILLWPVPPYICTEVLPRCFDS